MKRTVFLSLAVIAAAPAAALADDGLALPAVTYPALPETGGTIFDFIPPGWAMEPARPLRRLDEIGDGLEWHPDEAGEEGAEGQ
jgi:hypothetical protein